MKKIIISIFFLILSISFISATLEDYTTYTVLDDNNRFDITTNRINVTNIKQNEDAWIYDDKGEDHFGNDFEHEFEFISFGETVTQTRAVVWAVANVVDDNNGWQGAGVNVTKVIFFSGVGGDDDLDFSTLGDFDRMSPKFVDFKNYYFTVNRTGTTATAFVYNDGERTSLHDTMVVTLVTGVSYRYIFAVNSHNTGLNRFGNLSVANLDLKEVAADTTPPQINFTAPTNSDGVTIGNTSFLVNISIIESGILKNVTYNFDGTNFSYYDDYLVLAFNFDNVTALGEGNNNRTFDISSYKNNGTCIGQTGDGVAQCNYTTGKYGKAIIFDGVDDSIKVDDIDINYTTIAFWVKPNSLTSNSGFVSKWTPVAPDSAFRVWYEQATDELQFDAYTSVGSVTVAKSSILTTGNWQYITATYSSGGIFLYHNGVVVAGTAVGLNSIQVSSLNIYIGANNESNDFFDGAIDEVRIWNRSLSKTEVYQQYIANLNKFNTTNWNLWINQSLNASAGLSDDTYVYQGCAADSLDNWNCTEVRSITISTLVDSCTCPSSGNWVITGGDICSLTTTCDLDTNKLRVLDGRLRIQTGGKLIARGGCFIDRLLGGLFTDKLSGGSFCGT